MDDEQTDVAGEAHADPSAVAAYPYGTFEQNTRANALGIAHDREIAPEQVVDRAAAYAKFIIG